MNAGMSQHPPFTIFLWDMLPMVTFTWLKRNALKREQGLLFCSLTWEGGTKASIPSTPIFPQGFFTHRLSSIYFSPTDFYPTDCLTKYFFMFHFYKVFLGTMRNTQTPFHASFWAFPSSSHPTLGNHEKHPSPFSYFIFENYSWES